MNWRKLNLEGAIFLNTGKKALYQINKLFHYPPKGTKGVSQSAFVDDSAKIGKRVNIGPFSYIGANCVVGDNVTIFSNVSGGGTIGFSSGLLLGLFRDRSSSIASAILFSYFVKVG